LDKGSAEEIIVEYNKRNIKMPDQIFEQLSLPVKILDLRFSADSAGASDVRKKNY